MRLFLVFALTYLGLEFLQQLVFGHSTGYCPFGTGAVSDYDSQFRDSVFSAANACVFSPTIEEFFFRRFILGRLRNIFGLRFGLYISSILFCAAHYQYWAISLDLSRLGGLLLLGLVLGAVYIESDRLVYPVLFHCGINALILARKPIQPYCATIYAIEYLLLAALIFGSLLGYIEYALSRGEDRSRQNFGLIGKDRRSG